MNPFKKLLNLFLNINRPSSVSFDEVVFIANILYPKYVDEFKELVLLFQTDKLKFKKKYSNFIKEQELNFFSKNLINLLYSFGDLKGIVELVDWRGEENEREIEDFISILSSKKHHFKKTHQFRKNSLKIDQRDGEFILKLFKVLDEDLKILDERLLFFNNDWDAYGFTVVSQNNFEEIMNTSQSTMLNVDELR